MNLFPEDCNLDKKGQEVFMIMLGLTIFTMLAEPRKGAPAWRKAMPQGCGKTLEWEGCYKGRCLPCRQPEDRRELVLWGVPCGSADALALIMKKCHGNANEVLALVHPRLMQNIVVVNNVLKVRDKKYVW